ncbi:MAG: spore germination protein, partial [Bacillota bacterium]
MRKRLPRRVAPEKRRQRGTGSRRARPGGSAPPPAGDGSRGRGEESLLTGDIEEDLRRIRDTLHLPENSDVVLREIEIPLRKPRRAAVLFIGAMVDKRVLNSDVLGPLLSPLADHKARIEESLAEGRLEALFSRVPVSLEDSFAGISWEVSSGKVAVIVDGFDVAALADAAGWLHRNVEQPINERVVRGPHQAFVEPLKVNVTLVRRTIRSPDLVVETTRVGNLT